MFVCTRSLVFLQLVSTGFCVQLYMTHFPEYVKLQATSQPLSLYAVPDLILTMLGLKHSDDFSWNGLQSGNIFHRPKANLLLSIEGVDEKAIPLEYARKYAVDLGQQDTPFSMETVAKVVQYTFPNSLVMNSEEEAVEHMDSIDKVDVKSLKYEQAGDDQFLKELHQLHALPYSLKQQRNKVSDSSPDVFVFKIKSYKKIVSKYGEKSAQAGEARTLIVAAVKQVTKHFCGIYNNSVVVEVITLPWEHEESRRGRHLLATEEASQAASAIETQLNLATSYDENFPVMFNIILWTMLTLAVAVFGIGYCMWNMDNGKDSIYMMTTPRLKKE